MDSHVLVSEAVQRGACALLVEREIPPYPGVTMVRIENTQKALGPVAQAFYREPAREMNWTAASFCFISVVQRAISGFRAMWRERSFKDGRG